MQREERIRLAGANFKLARHVQALLDHLTFSQASPEFVKSLQQSVRALRIYAQEFPVKEAIEPAVFTTCRAEVRSALQALPEDDAAVADVIMRLTVQLNHLDRKQQLMEAQ